MFKDVICDLDAGEECILTSLPVIPTGELLLSPLRDGGWGHLGCPVWIRGFPEATSLLSEEGKQSGTAPGEVQTEY